MREHMITRGIRLGLAALVLTTMPGCDMFQRQNRPRDANAAPAKELSQPQQKQLADATAAKDHGDYDTALAMFQDLLAENPAITTAYLGIGEIYVIKEDYEKAEPAYARAAKLEPRNFDAQYGHGLSLQMLNRLVEAVKAYHRALTIEPEDVKANLNLATTYLQMNEAQSAVAFAEKAVALDPANGSARVNLGAAYEQVGRNAEAIDEYLVAMELVENTPPLMINLINVLGKEKRYREAVNTAENLIKIDPSANAYERLGWCQFRLADYEKSTAAYKEAVKLDKNHWQSLNGIGVNALNKWMLSKKRDRDAASEARDAFRRSLQVNPDQQKLITLMSNYGL
jgi:tetratricopeptide (TPR) repeat protein